MNFNHALQIVLRSNLTQTLASSRGFAVGFFCLLPMLTIAESRQDLDEAQRLRVKNVTRSTTDFSRAEPFEKRPGGAATSFASINANIFSHFSANLSLKGQHDFHVGNGLFDKVWVAAPASTHASDGLGPLFNARGCQNCHVKDGRGRPPISPDSPTISMVLHLSVPPRTQIQREHIKYGTITHVPEPTYGSQLQNFAVAGLAAEGRIAVHYEEIPVQLANDESVSLRKPIYTIADTQYGTIATDVETSARVAPPMIGLGLIESIDAGDIQAYADPNDQDNDGISGRVSQIWDPITKTFMLGRFGWKANTTSLRAQTAQAFSIDMGISTPNLPVPYGDCTTRQAACLAMPTGVQQALGNSEAPPPILDLVTFYAGHLAVPARRNVDDPVVLKGKQLFYNAGCTACHTPKFVTRKDAERLEHQFQLIWPYSDLLLHDMGEGLADHRTLSNASGSEWRTPPLWGIGLTKTVNGHTFFLHDGRARNLLEAILWHGGEAQASRNRIVNMSPAERHALIHFLESL